MSSEHTVRMMAYNMKQGGSKDSAVWARALRPLELDLLFVQESRDPMLGWLPALAGDEMAGRQSYLWTQAPGPHTRWGSGIWVRDGHLTPLDVPEDFEGRVVAAVVEGLSWPVAGATPVVALSIHAPTRKGSSYLKEVGRILDFAQALAAGRPLILAGDFNVVVGMRYPDQPVSISRGEIAFLSRIRDELGLVACWQCAHPGQQLARTLRWMHRIDSPPYHCDGFFVPASWASSLQSCDVLEDESWCALSDHNPVVATFAVDY